MLIDAGFPNSRSPSPGGGQDPPLRLPAPLTSASDTIHRDQPTGRTQPAQDLNRFSVPRIVGPCRQISWASRSCASSTVTPSPEEIAAILAVLAVRRAMATAAAAGTSPAQARSAWSDRSRPLRAPLFHSPGNWRRAALPC